MTYTPFGPTVPDHRSLADLGHADLRRVRGRGARSEALSWLPADVAGRDELRVDLGDGTLVLVGPIVRNATRRAPEQPGGSRAVTRPTGARRALLAVDLR